MNTRLWSSGALLALALILRPAYAQDESLELGSDYDHTELLTATDSIAATYADQVQMPPTPDNAAETVVTPEASDGEVYSSGTYYPGGGNGYVPGPATVMAPNCPSCVCPPKRDWHAQGYLFSGLESFRNIASGSYPGNNGFVNGGNVAHPLGFLGEYGIGVQAGGSYGFYDLSGKVSPGSGLNEMSQQWFFTTGLFRRATAEVPLSFGAVWDLMITDNYGAFGNAVTLSQVRGQIAYATNAWNELGFWAALHDPSETKATGALGLPISYRAINQFNFFWHHKFGQNGADCRFYVGFPEQTRLSNSTNSGPFPIGGSNGSLGSLILGTNWNVPITDWLALYANGVYMNPSAHPGVSSTGAFAAVQESWAMSFGAAIYPGRAARSATVTGRQWMPYMPVANNGTFLVDASITQ